MDLEGTFLLEPGFLSDEMITSTTALNYEPADVKYNYSQHDNNQSSLLETSNPSLFSSGSPNLESPCSTASSLLPTSLDSSSVFDFSLTKSEDEVVASTPSLSPPSVQPQPTIKKSNHGGRKRSIIFEQEEAEFQRKEFLERNRIAASKCRQKKKKWMKDLETNYEKLSTQNQQLRSMVILYQDEINSLKTELLSRNGLCSCADMRSYIQQNSTNMDPTKMLMQDYGLLSALSKKPQTVPIPSSTNIALPPLALPPYLNE